MKTLDYLISTTLIVLFNNFMLSAVSAQENDFSNEEEYTFVLEEVDDEKYELTSDVIITNRYLTYRAQKYKKYQINEHFFDPISRIKGKSENKYYSRKDFFVISPDMEDVFINTNKLYILSIDEKLKKGDFISIEYSKEYTDMAYLPALDIPNIDCLKSFKVIIEHPEEVKPKFEFFFPRNKFHYSITYPDDDETVLEIEQLCESKKLKFFPYNEIHAKIFLEFKKDVRILNPTNARGFVNWYGSITDLEPKLDCTDNNIFDDEIKNAETDYEKLRIIYDYVRKNIRYIAEEQDINAFVPRKPSLVYNRKYGDCKDKASLVSAISREYGIKVNMVLVSTELNSGIENFYLAKYNHVICSYHCGNNILFFDPTAKYCEFGNLPENNIGKEVLILDSQKPLKTVINPPNNNPSITVEIFADIDSLDNCRAIVTLKNDYYSSAQHAINELTRVKQENYLSNIVTSNFYKISLDLFQYLSKGENYITFSAKADISKFIISSRNKKYLPKTPFSFLENDILERENDQYGIYISKRFNFELKINLKINDYQFESGELSLGSENKGIKFTAKADSTKSGSIELFYKINQSLKVYNGNIKNSFLDFCENYLTNKKEMFILRGQNENK